MSLTQAEAAPSRSLGTTMQNILVSLAERARSRLHYDYSFEQQSKSPHKPNSNTLEDKRQMMQANKAMFADIFGEEAPAWWGNFSATAR